MSEQLQVNGRSYRINRLGEIGTGDVSSLPYSLKVLLENLVRKVDGVSVTEDDVAALAAWDPDASEQRELSFSPARILLQDFTGVPAVVDLAAMRDAVSTWGARRRR